VGAGVGGCRRVPGKIEQKKVLFFCRWTHRHIQTRMEIEKEEERLPSSPREAHHFHRPLRTEPNGRVRPLAAACRRVAVSPCRRVAVSPCRRVAVSPCCCLRLFISHLGNLPDISGLFTKPKFVIGVLHSQIPLLLGVVDSSQSAVIATGEKPRFGGTALVG